MKKVTIRRITGKTLSITGRALLFIAESIDDFIFELNHPSLTEMLGVEGARRYLHYKYERIPYPIDRLKKNDWITTRKIGNKIIIRLTQNGKIAALQLKIANVKKHLDAGSEILVAFDIPESATNTRKIFRESLKRMGFRRQQLSIWSTNKNIVKELKQYIGLLKIGKWVTLYRANKIQ